MIALNLNELKKIQLEILKYVHEFCIRNEICYFLVYGTLIGAVRHQGYIPWDDDIDICMPRPDYERFLKLFNKSKNRYQVEAFELNDNFPYTFGKVEDLDTTFIEKMGYPFPIGVNIDVFPIDGVDNDRELIKKQIFLRKLINLKTIIYSKERNLIKNIVLYVGKFLLLPVSLKFLVGKMIKNSKKYKYETAEKVCVLAMGTKLNKPIDKKVFKDGLLVKFEDYQFYIPIGYDVFLKSIFGDYMKLPPEEKRKSHHVFRAYYKD